MKKNRLEAYQEQARSMLDSWSMDISRLRAQAVLLEAGERSEAVRRLAELDALYGEVFRQYVAMQVNVNGRLDDLKRAFERAAAPLCEALDQPPRKSPERL